MERLTLNCYGKKGYFWDEVQFIDGCKKNPIKIGQDDTNLTFLIFFGGLKDVRQKILDFEYTCGDDCSSILEVGGLTIPLRRIYNPQCQNRPRYMTRSHWQEHKKRQLEGEKNRKSSWLD